jgi:hypothetical protein
MLRNNGVLSSCTSSVYPLQDCRAYAPGLWMPTAAPRIGPAQRLSQDPRLRAAASQAQRAAAARSADAADQVAASTATRGPTDDLALPTQRRRASPARHPAAAPPPAPKTRRPRHTERCDVGEPRKLQTRTEGQAITLRPSAGVQFPIDKVWQARPVLFNHRIKSRLRAIYP